jgi:hypothetical protein
MDFLKKHGEKILLLLLIAGLGISVVLALANVGGLQNSSARSLVPPKGGASLDVKELDETLARLTETPPTVDVGIGTFTPEIRVMCINQDCRSLIPPDAEICVICGNVQTIGPRDSDGDGISDRQELAWGMDPTDPNDVYLDQDDDGFPTVYEIENDTDPSDSSSTPDLIKFVRLKDVEETSIEFELRGTARLGESYTLQLFWKYPGESRGTTAYVRVGRRFGRNNEFLAESFTEERVLEGNRYVDKSVAVIRSGRYETKLGRTKGTRAGTMTERRATLETIFGPELDMEVRVDETIEVGKKSYNVVDIHRDAVVLQPDVDSEPQPDPITIKPKTPEDEEALEKFRPAGAPDGGDDEEGMNPEEMFPPDFF